jgi:hypothetical protein
VRKVEETSTLSVFEVKSQRVRAGSFQKEPRSRKSSGELVPLLRSHRTKVVERRTLQEEENRRLEFVVESHEIPQTVRSRRSCEGVNSQVHERIRLSSKYRHIGAGECKSCMHVEIASCDFPI